MSEQQYKEWFQHVDKDGSGSLTYSELYDFLTEQRGYTQEQVEVSFLLFAMINVNLLSIYHSLILSLLQLLSCALPIDILIP